MDFYQKYELLDLLKDEGVKVFNARETATGRQITIFLFVGEQARLHADLLEQLRVAQRPDRPVLLEVGDNQGIPFVATEPLGGLADLKRIAVVAQTPTAPRAGRPPDAFTRVGVWHIPAPTRSGAQGATPVTPLPPAATAPPAPAQAAPGEFTRMFQASAPPQPMGETAPPAGPPAPPAQTAPGEFTRFFQSALSRAPEPTPTPASSAPGEFTRIFGRGDMPAAQAATPAPSAGPGEYTRMFSAQPVLPPQPPAPAPPAAPVSAKKVPWLTVALVVVVVVLLAIIAIMAFALRK